MCNIDKVYSLNLLQKVLDINKPHEYIINLESL